MKRIQIALVVMLASIAIPASGRDAQLFRALYAFGDSLADNGNDFIFTRAVQMDPAIPPSVSPHRTYFNGRFSNGAIVFEYLWSLMSGAEIGSRDAMRPFLAGPRLTGTEGVSFAFGGSRTGYFDPLPGGVLNVPGLRAQVDLFRAAMPAQPHVARALYAIATGSNEYLTGATDPQAVAHNIAAAVATLYAAGARNMIVLTVPNLGQLPIAATLPPLARDGLTALSQAHNAALAVELSALQSTHPDLAIMIVDVDAFLAGLGDLDRQVPALDAMFNAPPLSVSMCLFADLTMCPDVTDFTFGDTFLFWDAEHPTTAVHARLAKQLWDELTDGASLDGHPSANGLHSAGR